MTKKRIADLLKEEVEKTTASSETKPEGKSEIKSESKPEVPLVTATSQPSSLPSEPPAQKPPLNAQRVSKTASRTTANKPVSADSRGDEPQDTHVQDAAESGAIAPTQPQQSTPAPIESSVSAAASDPSAILAKQAALESELIAAKAQISDLQADLATHQSRILELKEALTKAEQGAIAKTDQLEKMSKAYEDAKETIRQLMAAPPAPTPAAPAPPAPEPPSHPIMGADLAARQMLDLRQRPTSSRKAIPEYAIQREEQNSMLSDEDIGWVD